MAAQEHTINNGAKWGMLMMALLFDAVQFITQGVTDVFITAFAAMVFGMLFLEKGALKTSGKGALKLFRFIVPFAEVFIGNLPGITLEVWILIKISRIADLAIPESLQGVVSLGRRRGAIKGIVKNAKTAHHQGKQLRKYAKARSVRAKRRASRAIGGNASSKTSSKQQRLQNTKVTT